MHEAAFKGFGKECPGSGKSRAKISMQVTLTYLKEQAIQGDQGKLQPIRQELML